MAIYNTPRINSLDDVRNTFLLKAESQTTLEALATQFQEAWLFVLKGIVKDAQDPSCYMSEHSVFVGEIENLINDQASTVQYEITIENQETITIEDIEELLSTLKNDRSLSSEGGTKNIVQISSRLYIDDERVGLLYECLEESLKEYLVGEDRVDRANMLCYAFRGLVDNSVDVGQHVPDFISTIRNSVDSLLYRIVENEILTEIDISYLKYNKYYDINSTYDFTPNDWPRILTCAVIGRKPDNVQLLLEMGANPYLQDCHGKALDVAMKNGDTETTKVLTEWMESHPLSFYEAKPELLTAAP